MKPLLFFSAIVFLFVSCKKNQLGGSATITGKVVHHEKAIPGARIFIKFNAKEFPGADTNLYNSKVVADQNGLYTISCYKGDYYLYGYGYDAQLKETVKGGLHVKTRNNELVETDIAITE